MINKNIGYSNNEMVEYCKLIQSVISKKIIVKVGKGKNIINTEVYKYSKDIDIIESASKSIEYYKNLAMKDLELKKAN